MVKNVKKIRMIGLDLDGTLLREDKTLSTYSKEVIAEAIRRGIIVLVATGRPISGIPKELREFPGMRYVLSANGARIVDQQEKRIISEELLPKETARQVMNVLGKYDCMREIYYDGIGFAEERYVERADEFFRNFNNPTMAAYIKKTRRIVNSIEKKLEEEERALDKVQGIFLTIEEKNEAWKMLEQIPGITITGALKNNIEVGLGGVNKGTGLIRLGKMLGVSMEEIMACGDGMNDYDMINEVGFGVVMENGREELKAIADFVTKTNEEDGVAYAIEKYVLNHVTAEKGE